MAEERLGLQRQENVRAQEKHDRAQKAPIGNWKLQNIEQRITLPGMFPGEEKSVEATPKYVLVNDKTGEVKPYTGPIPGVDSTKTVNLKPMKFDDYWAGYQKNRLAKYGSKVPDTPENRAVVREHAEHFGYVFKDDTDSSSGKNTDGEAKNGDSTGNENKKIVIPHIFDDDPTVVANLDSGIAPDSPVPYTKRVLTDAELKALRGKIRDAGEGALDLLTKAGKKVEPLLSPEEVFVAAVKAVGITVDTGAWAVNQFLNSEHLIHKPIGGTVHLEEVLRRLAPYYEKGKSLTKEKTLEILSEGKQLITPPSPVDSFNKGISERDEKINTAIDEWNLFTDEEKASRNQVYPEGYREPTTDIESVSGGTVYPEQRGHNVVGYGQGGLGDIPPRQGGLITTEPGTAGKGGVSMDAGYLTLPGTLPRAHGQDDPQEAGRLTRADVKAMIETAIMRPEQPVETNVLMMGYDQVVQIVREMVQRLGDHKMNKRQIIDQLYRVVQASQDQEGFKGSDYEKALNDVIIELGSR